MESITLLLFCGSLIACIFLNISVLWALVIGLLLFLLYGRRKGFAWKALLDMALSGVKTIQNILVMLLLIGVLTALWRASGTIPVIVCYAARLIRPSIFLVMAFLLNCGVSVLTGTSFGTAATMGSICMTMATAMGIPPVFAGGAILSGVFFGDRCSPVSTSALLVCTLTGTEIFPNIKRMLRTAVLPFLASCAIYIALGALSPTSAAVMNVRAIFSQHFRLHWIALLPAAVILILSAFQVPVIRTLLTSILLAAGCCVFLQSRTVSELFQIAILGYSAPDASLGAMLNGGGVLSMVNVCAIVCISSTYAGIFQDTGLLDHTKDMVAALSRRITPYGGVICTSIAAAVISCNQTLASMLVYQLCDDLVPDRQKLAIYLENSVIVISPLVPWSIAGATPLASISAPTWSLLFACYLYLLPILTFLQELLRPSRQKAA